jgi:hypothetical protein
MTTKRKVGRPRSRVPPSVRATVSIPVGTYRLVEGLANQKKVSVAWVVREALDEYLAEQWPLLGKAP